MGLLLPTMVTLKENRFIIMSEINQNPKHVYNNIWIYIYIYIHTHISILGNKIHWFPEEKNMMSPATAPTYTSTELPQQNAEKGHVGRP